MNFYYKLVTVGQHETMWSYNVSINEYDEIVKRGRTYLGTPRCLRYRLREMVLPDIGSPKALFVFSSPEECEELNYMRSSDKKSYILKGLAENPRRYLASDYPIGMFETKRMISKGSIICTGFYPISIYARL